MSALLVQSPDPPLSVRLRIALDVLGKLVERGGGPLEARRLASRMRIEGVRLGSDGVSHLELTGDDSGVQVLLWEILLARALPRHGGQVPPAARSFLNREARELGQLVEGSLDGAGPITRVEGLYEAVLGAGRARTATHEAVRAAFGLAPITAQPTSGSFERSPRESQALPAQTAEALAAAWQSLAAATAATRQRLRAPVLPRRSPSTAGFTPISSPTWPAVRQPTPPAGVSAAPTRRWTPLPGPISSVTPQTSRALLILANALDADRIRMATRLRDAGYKVNEVVSADAALEAVIQSAPAAVIADFELLGRSGDDLARRIRALTTAAAATPVLLMASPTMTRARLAPFSIGADARLSKPVSDETLIVEVNRLVALGPHLRRARAGLDEVEGSPVTKMSGELEHLTAGGLLAILELERRTGLCRASNEGETAGLELASGLVIRGWIGGELVDRALALRTFVKMNEGAFSFHATAPRAAPRDAIAPHTLLVEEAPVDRAR